MYTTLYNKKNTGKPTQLWKITMFRNGKIVYSHGPYSSSQTVRLQEAKAHENIQCVLVMQVKSPFYAP